MRWSTHTHIHMLYKACSDEEAKKETARSPLLSLLLCIVRAIYSFCPLRIPQKYNMYIPYVLLYIVYTYMYANSYQKKACRECIAHNHISCTPLFI